MAPPRNDDEENIGTDHASHMLVKRRDLLTMTGALAFLGACSESQVYPNFVRALRYVTTGLPDTPIDRSAISRAPYAYISGKIGRGPRSILVLWKSENGDLLWLSADNVAIVTRFGRVVKTAGLPQEILNTDFSGEDPVIDVARTGERRRHQRTLDLRADGKVSTIEIASTVSRLGPTRITIEGLEFDTVHVRETSFAVGTSWSFTNNFWVDPLDQIVWRSEQHIGQLFPPIEIDVLKPPG